MSELRVTVDDGKYTYVAEADGKSYALRHGEPWQEMTGNKFVYCLAARIEELEAAVLAAHPPAAQTEPEPYDKDDSLTVAYMHGFHKGVEAAKTAHPPAQDSQTFKCAMCAILAPAQDTQVEIPHGLENALIAECERAMRQRNTFLKSGKSTAGHGRSHDTCFGFILRKFLGKKSERLPAQDLQDAKDAG